MTAGVRFAVIFLAALVVGGLVMARFSDAVRAGNTGLVVLLGLVYVGLILSVGWAGRAWRRSKGWEK